MFNQRLILHWGANNNNNKWFIPQLNHLTLNTIKYNNCALQTEFIPNKGSSTKTLQIVLFSYKESNNIEEEKIEGITFALYSPEENRWYNNNNQNYHILFKENNFSTVANKTNEHYDIASEIVKCETKEVSWSLMHRYNKCYDIMSNECYNNNNNENNAQNYLWLYLWLQIAKEKQLDWQREYNTRPKDLAYSMRTLVNELAIRYINSAVNERYYNHISHSNSSFVRMILSQIGKGEANGSEMRTRLLDLFHKTDIQLTGDRFYSQWYQKIQNNNSIEDVIICQALVNYLHTGNINDYRNTLIEGGITKSRLESYERPITMEPRYKPEYLPDLKYILFKLKSIHLIHDIAFFYESVKRIFGSIGIIEEVINDLHKYNRNNNNNAHITSKDIERLVQCRMIINRLIKFNIYSVNKVKDLLYLDNAIEPILIQLLSQCNLNENMDLYHYIEQISLILNSISFAYPKYSKLIYSNNAWMIITSKISKEKNISNCDEKILMKLYETCMIVSHMLSEISSLYINSIDNKAHYIGEHCNINSEYYTKFSETSLSNTLFYQLSIRLNQLESLIIKQIHIKDWIIINKESSYSRLQGKIIKVNTLKDAQCINSSDDIIIIANSIEGNEEIPNKCKGIIIYDNNATNYSYPFIFSHISLKAKKKNIFFGICFQSEHIQTILKYEQQEVTLKINGKNIECNIRKQNIISSNKLLVNITSKKEVNSICFRPLINNAINNKKIDSSGIETKEIIKPFESNTYSLMRYYLSLDSNKDINQQLIDQLSLLSTISSSTNTEEILRRCKVIIMDIEFPFDNIHTRNITRKLITCGHNDNDIAESMNTIKSYWMSSLSIDELKLLPRM